MQLLQTPPDRFAAVDFDAPVRSVRVPDGDGGSLQMAVTDTGPADAPVVLLLHGEPTWSYLYRKVIPVLVRAGLRAVAPDLVGFGRSDKPARTEDHTYRRHLDWLRSALFDALNLTGITLVGQDWGGLLGLPLAMEQPQRFDRIVAANTGLPTGDQPMPDVWWRFRRAVEQAPVLDVGRLVSSGCRRSLSERVRAAYDAPFPDESFKAGPRAMPTLVPTAPSDPQTPANRQAWAALGRWSKPFLVAFSDGDPITGPMRDILIRVVPGAAGRDHPVLSGAGHFLQEDAGEELGRLIAEFVHRS
jgi:haloalkane dehalogenase